MKIIFNSILVFIVAFVGVFSVYNFVPLKYFEIAQPKKLGSTITTILGTDTLSASRSVINTNFSNLNTDKIEATQTTLNSLTSASSLATVGTITSGIWNGTAIGVGYGGTGTTSPTLNQIMLGNGSSGLKVVNGLGSSGQFLTSQGAGSPPTWSTGTTDLTANYIWTGTHLFTASSTHTATTSILANSLTNGAFIINGLATKWPSIRGASSTTLKEDGTGNLVWDYGDWALLVSTTTTASMSTTTMTLPATKSDLRVVFETNGAAASSYYMTFNSDTGTNYGVVYMMNGTPTGVSSQKSAIVGNSGGGNSSTLTLDIQNVSTIAKTFTGRQVQFSGAVITEFFTITGVWNNTSSAISSIQIGNNSAIPSGTKIRIYGGGN